MSVPGLPIDLCHDADDPSPLALSSCTGGAEERNSFWGRTGGFCIYFSTCVCFWVDDRGLESKTIAI